MVTDAHGCMKVDDPDNDLRDAVIMAMHILDRDYALFGAWNGAGWTGTSAAVIGGRGLSEDLATQVLADIKEWSPVRRPTRVAVRYGISLCPTGRLNRAAVSFWVDGRLQRNLPT